LQDRIIFSSFYLHNLLAARQLLPNVPCGLLIPEGKEGWQQRIAARISKLEAEHPNTADVTAELVKRVHIRGRRMHVWTVNDPIDMNRLRSYGVDGIFSDDPLLACKYFG
jgi:glycerophosphoryl diester phosphodiesterase